MVLEVDPASNRNEYKESTWGGGVKGGWRLRLTTLPPYVIQNYIIKRYLTG
jgi:nitrogen fixation protein